MTTTPQTKYFDLHIHGIGYVNRIREVNVKRGENFWACDISALHGAEDDVQYTRFDCRVSGSEAGKLIKRMHKACQEEKKILIGFKLGDLYADKRYLTGRCAGLNTAIAGLRYNTSSLVLILNGNTGITAMPHRIGEG